MRTHDDVWPRFVNTFPSSLALLLPDALHGESTELDGFRGSRCRSTDSLSSVGSMPQIGKHGNAASVDDLYEGHQCTFELVRAKALTRHRVFVLVDQVL